MLQSFETWVAANPKVSVFLTGAGTVAVLWLLSHFGVFKL